MTSGIKSFYNASSYIYTLEGLPFVYSFDFWWDISNLLCGLSYRLGLSDGLIHGATSLGSLSYSFPINYEVTNNLIKIRVRDRGRGPSRWQCLFHCTSARRRIVPGGPNHRGQGWWRCWVLTKQVSCEDTSSFLSLVSHPEACVLSVSMLFPSCLPYKDLNHLLIVLAWTIAPGVVKVPGCDYIVLSVLIVCSSVRTTFALVSCEWNIDAPQRGKSHVSLSFMLFSLRRGVFITVKSDHFYFSFLL